MKYFTFLVPAIAAIVSLVVFTVPAPGHADAGPAPFVTEIPNGYRDWQWVSSAHEAGNLNSLGAVLGNDIAIKAYREGKLPFPDGSIIAALHYRNVPSDENNRVFGKVPSYVPGAPTNIQFMVKDSKVRGNGRLGIRSLQRRQACRRGFHEALLSLPREGPSDRPRLHSLCTLIIRNRARGIRRRPCHSQPAA